MNPGLLRAGPFWTLGSPCEQELYSLVVIHGPMSCIHSFWFQNIYTGTYENLLSCYTAYPMQRSVQGFLLGAMRKSEKGHKPIMDFKNFLGNKSGHLHLLPKLYAIYLEPTSNGSPDILFTRFTFGHNV